MTQISEEIKRKIKERAELLYPDNRPRSSGNYLNKGFKKGAEFVYSLAQEEIDYYRKGRDGVLKEKQEDTDLMFKLKETIESQAKEIGAFKEQAEILADRFLRKDREILSKDKEIGELREVLSMAAKLQRADMERGMHWSDRADFVKLIDNLLTPKP